MRPISLALALAFATPVPAAPTLPAWVGKIRKDHPRLFFNAETWPAVRARALGPEKAWYERTKARVDRLRRDLEARRGSEDRDLGPDAARAAFVYRMTGDETYLDVARAALAQSLAFYEACYEARKTVNWYSTSRVHAVLAWDWLYGDLAEAERRDTMSRLVRVLQNVFTAKPAIYRENISGYSTGFYGAPNVKWFIGCTAYGTGIEEALVNEWLVWGHDENRKMLEHRRDACGDDGGSASPTLGYAFGAYPWAEQNFIYTWRSATGEDLAPAWPHAAWLANYVIWNWIETGSAPREFGYGDTPHTHNRLPIGELYTHMANVRHLFGRSEPEAAALARHLQERLPDAAPVSSRDERVPRGSDSWFIYPFLWDRIESSPPALAPERLPKARHFERMGQIFLRSGTGADDTYCLFSCGGALDQHRHFDALNFVIYHKGHLALDSGTRYKEEVNGQHLANYFAQTAAHNCVLVHQDGEPPARYWGGEVEGCHGGQHRALGSVVKAFAPRDRYVYVAGDATASYLHGGRSARGGPRPEKVSLVARQIVFLLPRHFVIFDRVIATDPSYRKEWLLHTAHEPAIDGKTFRADQEGGRIFCRTLLPVEATLAAVGGPGKEFWAAGKNWSIDASGLGPDELAMMGQWRAEVRPGAACAEDLFLHVIEVGDRTLAAMGPLDLLESDGSPGVRIRAGSATWEVTFATKGDLGGHIRFQEGGVTIDEPLRNVVEPQRGILVAEAARPPEIPQWDPKNGPLTAAWVARAYGPLWVKEGDRLASRDARKSLEKEGYDSTRTWIARSGRDELTVTEHFVGCEPYKIVVTGRWYFDPIVDLETGLIVSAVYGFEEATPEDPALPITVGGDDLRALIDAIRTESYDDYPDVNWRSVRSATTGYGGAWGKGTLVRELGCTLGLRLHLANGKMMLLSGFASHGGSFTRCDNKARSFRNGAIFEILKQIAARRGAELRD